MATDEVYHFLKKEARPVTAVEISKRLGISSSSIRKNLQRLLKRKEVAKIRSKNYNNQTESLWEATC